MIEWMTHPNGGGKVHRGAVVDSGAVVHRGAVVCSGAVVDSGAVVCSGAVVHRGAVVDSGAVVCSGVVVHRGAVVDSGAVVCSGAVVHRGAVVDSGAVVCSGAVVHRGAVVDSGAVVGANTRTATIGPIGSRNDRLTAYWCVTPEGSGIEFVTGCFVGTGEQLLAECDETHGPDSPHTRDYAEAVALLTRLVLAHVPAELRPTEEDGQ